MLGKNLDLCILRFAQRFVGFMDLFILQVEDKQSANKKKKGATGSKFKGKAK